MLLCCSFFKGVMARCAGMVAIFWLEKAINGECRGLRVLGVESELGVFRRHLLLKFVTSRLIDDRKGQSNQGACH